MRTKKPRLRLARNGNSNADQSALRTQTQAAQRFKRKQKPGPDQGTFDLNSIVKRAIDGYFIHIGCKESGENTGLEIGDVLLVDRSLKIPIRRDLVVYEHPDNANLPWFVDHYYNHTGLSPVWGIAITLVRSLKGPLVPNPPKLPRATSRKGPIGPTGGAA